MITFSDFIRARNITNSPRGAFLAEMKTLINAGAVPPVREWPELYRFFSRQRASDETITIARQLWREYRKLESAGVDA